MRSLNVNTRPLLDAIDRYIAKADEDLEETLADEGYPAADVAVKLASDLEEAVDDALDEDVEKLLKHIRDAIEVEDFISNIWPGIKEEKDLEDALYKIFHEKFDDMLKKFTYEWTLAQNPVIAGIDEEITKPAEAFVKGWSAELARLMNLSTKDTIERLLLKAHEKAWSIDDLTDAIGNSGLREHGYRSRRVALTEMLRMESYAQQEEMVQDPLAYKKKWRHVMSANPRENHMAMDGQTVYKRECFTLVGADGSTYYVICPRDTCLPASESVNCHCLVDVISDANAKGMTEDEMKERRRQYMNEINAEYEAWEQKFKEDYGIDEPRDDPSVTWEIYNSYYEAYRRGEIA